MYVNHDLSERTSEFKSKSPVFHEDRALLGETETIAEKQTSFTNLLVTSSSKFSWSPVLGLTCPYLVHRENNYLSSRLQDTSFTFLKIHFPHIWDYIASTKLLFIIQVWVLKVESHTCYLKNKTKQKNLWGGVTKMIKIYCIKMNSDSVSNTLQLLWHLHCAGQEDRPVLTIHRNSFVMLLRTPVYRETKFS